MMLFTFSYCSDHLSIRLYELFNFSSALLPCVTEPHVCQLFSYLQENCLISHNSIQLALDGGIAPDPEQCLRSLSCPTASHSTFSASHVKLWPRHNFSQPGFNSLQLTYVCGLNLGWLNPGSTQIRQNRVECGRAQPRLNPGSRASADMPLEALDLPFVWL